MHEIGIADAILESVRADMRQRPTCRAIRVGVRIGKLAAIDPESLQFCFEVLTRETDLDGLQLDVELCPRDELDLAYLEVDEHEPSGIGRESPK